MLWPVRLPLTPSSLGLIYAEALVCCLCEIIYSEQMFYVVCTFGRGTEAGSYEMHVDGVR